MRKLKLLLAACTLLGASAVWAQTDVTTTYLKNADFSSTEGWTEYVSKEYKDYGNGKIGEYNVRFSPATVDDTHLDSEYCFGFECRWKTNYASYQQTTEAELPAGIYKLSFDVENVNGATTSISYDNLFYVQVGETKTIDSSTEWMSGKKGWVTHSISFTLEESAPVTISLGYGTGEGDDHNIGAANTPALYVSHLKLEFFDEEQANKVEQLSAAKKLLNGYLEKANALNSVLDNSTLSSAITSAQSAYDEATDYDSHFSTVQTQTSNLSDAIEGAVSNLELIALENADFNTSVNISVDGTNSASIIDPATEAKPYIYPVSGWEPNFTFNSTAAQGTTAAYGATITGNYGNNGTNPPAADMFGGTDGGTLHLSSGWNDQARYKQTIENLPTGRYLFYYEANNQNANATALVNNYFGVSGNSGDFYGTSNGFVFSAAKEFPYNEWSANAFEFDVAQSADITFHVGLTGSTGGSGGSPKLWVDNVLVYRIADLEVTDADAEKIIAEAEALADAAFMADYKSALNSALTTFQGSKSMDNYIALNTAIASAKASVEVYKKLDPAIKNIEGWSTQGTAADIRSKYTNGEYDDEATAEGIYEEYQAAEIAALANNDASDWTSAILNPSFETGNLTCWSAEKRDDTGVKENSNATYNIANGVDGKYVFNSWGGTAENNVYQIVKSLPSGTYTLSALLAGFVGEQLVLSANEKTASLTVDGDKTTGYTVNVVFEHSGGDLTIKACNTKSQDTSDRSFIKADNFQLFKGGLASDYTALNEAIAAAEGKTLGFEDGQYAPYNNVEVLTALADAKAIDQEGENSQAMIDGLVEILNEGWTSNSGDVDIIYNGHFAEADGNNPKGWSRSNGAWGQQITGLASSTGAEEGTAWYYNTEGAWEYGKAGVYTMPLPANTAYTLTFKYRSHAWDSNNWMKVSVLKGEEGLAETKFDKNPSNENFVTATVSFSTGEAGNYVLSLVQSGNTHLTDVSMVKASAVTAEVTADGYATFVSNAQLDFSATAIKAYTAKVEGDKVVLTQIDKVPAKMPVVLYCAGGNPGEVIPFAATVDTPEASDLVAGNDGTVASSDDDGYTNYILNNGQGIGFYHANNQTVAKDRAYLHVKGGSDARLSIVFDGEATGISEMKRTHTGEAVYNLSGQRVVSPKKGLYIIGGKKAIVK